MKIILGSDKSGFYLKEAVKDFLNTNGYDVIETGTVTPEKGISIYEVTPQACSCIQKGDADLGILIYGTGMGMSQVANKFKGIRAACVVSIYGARMAPVINNSNILCMDGWILAPEMAIEMVKAFLQVEHTEGVEEWRRDFLKNALVKIEELEDNIYGRG